VRATEQPHFLSVEAKSYHSTRTQYKNEVANHTYQDETLTNKEANHVENLDSISLLIGNEFYRSLCFQIQCVMWSNAQREKGDRHAVKSRTLLQKFSPRSLINWL